MKYELMVRSRPEETDFLPKHQRAMKAMTVLKGWNADHLPPLKIAATAPKSTCLLHKALPSGIRGVVDYQNRKYTRDEAMFDDLIDIQFKPEKTGLAAMLGLLPELVRAFDAYWAHIGDIALGVHDFDNGARQVETRTAVFRFYPVTYLDAELLRRALSLTIPQAVARLAKKVPSVEELHKGVLIISATQPVSITEANEINRRVSALLRH